MKLTKWFSPDIPWDRAPTWANWVLIRRPAPGVHQMFWLQKKPKTMCAGDTLKQIPSKRPSVNLHGRTVSRRH